MDIGEFRRVIVYGLLSRLGASQLAGEVRVHRAARADPSWAARLEDMLRRAERQHRAEGKEWPNALRGVCAAMVNLIGLDVQVRAESSDRVCSTASWLFVSEADLQERFEHRELTAVCLASTVGPFPFPGHDLTATLAVVEQASVFVPADDTFPVWLAMFMALADDWHGTTLELAEAAFVLSRP